MRYACIDRRRNRYPIRLLCRLLQVSPSGYYAWRVRAESRRSRYDRDLMRAIRFTHAESDGTYGSPRIHADVNAGVNWGHGAGVRRDHLLMPDTVLPVVPGVHWRDPRCFV